jgi:ribulose-5-phosphate 4-epimerase/fuculose-1-phosphate aldolase
MCCPRRARRAIREAGAKQDANRTDHAEEAVMSVRAVSKASPVRAASSEAEWTARVDLAACYRLMAHFGVNDLTYNHLSARVPDDPEALLIKSSTVMFDEVTASSLLKYRFDGTPLSEGAPKLVGGGYVIHAGILDARRDLNAVFHTHTPANMGVSAQKHGLLMINQHAMRFYKRIAYHHFKGFEFDLAMRNPLIEDLGDKKVALLRNHGCLVCGGSVAEAFVLHHFLEMACRGQIAALSGGAEVILPTEAACEYAAGQVNRDDASFAGSKDWGACLRLADRLDPGFRD